MSSAKTSGLNHLGLSVKNLEQTMAFFTNLLGWQMSGYDANYPRCAVTDGQLRLTLWQVESPDQVTVFSRRQNLGLHHLALQVDTEQQLNDLYEAAKVFTGVEVEFPPELLGSGPRKHMMCTEPGGLRIEFIWPGN